MTWSWEFRFLSQGHFHQIKVSQDFKNLDPGSWDERLGSIDFGLLGFGSKSGFKIEIGLNQRLRMGLERCVCFQSCWGLGVRSFDWSRWPWKSNLIIQTPTRSSSCKRPENRMERICDHACPLDSSAPSSVQLHAVGTSCSEENTGSGVIWLQSTLYTAISQLVDSTNQVLMDEQQDFPCVVVVVFFCCFFPFCWQA